MPNIMSGKPTTSTTNGSTWCSNMSSTLVTSSTGSPNNTDLAAKLAASTGPVKNANNVKLFLKQRSLIALENNYSIETLANLLISMSFKARVPDHVASIMHVVSFLIIGKTQNTFAEELAATVVEKLLSATVQITKQIDHEQEFLTVSAANQAEQTQKLTELTNSFTIVSKTLTTTPTTPTIISMYPVIICQHHSFQLTVSHCIPNLQHRHTWIHHLHWKQAAYPRAPNLYHVWQWSGRLTQGMRQSHGILTTQQGQQVD